MNTKKGVKFKTRNGNSASLIDTIINLSGNVLFWGIALCFGAMKTPKSLQEFMFSYGGGGMSAISGAISTAHHITSLKRVINKVK